MTEFTQGWVNIWIIVLTLVNLLGCLWLLWFTRKRRDDPHPIKEGESMGHSFDGIEELNNPLPKWWLNLFYITIAFAFIYMFLYPSWGDDKGMLGWTSVNQWEMEVQKANNQYDRLFEEYAAVPIPELISNDEVMKTGQRLFAQNCAVCHGSNARGNLGFPNLTDDDWLYGGTPEKILETLQNGRAGMMPAHIAILGGEKAVKDVAAYVLSLSGRKGSGDAEAGKAKFAICSACHGADGKGNQLLGAPNLTDDIWLYGGSEERIVETLVNGRNGVMPSFAHTLSPEKRHVVAAYVYSLSQ